MFSDAADPALIEAAIFDMKAAEARRSFALQDVYKRQALTLLDATRKKIDFLSEVCAALSLKNVAPTAGRAEEVAALPSHRERYELVVSLSLIHI